MIENDIVPRFYDRPEGDTPRPWVAMMKASILKTMGYFNSQRMVSEYQTLFYEPARADYHRLMADGGRLAGRLDATHRRLGQLWGRVKAHIPRADKDISQLHVGDRFNVVALVQLGEIKPDEVRVQVYQGPVDSDNHIISSNARDMTLAEDRGKGEYVFKQELHCEATGRYGLTVRVIPAGNEWASVMPGFMTWADHAESGETVEKRGTASPTH